MNKLSLINHVKYNRFIYRVYNFVGSKAISLMKLFLHSDEKLIFFVAYGGRKYDDSPKAIYEMMLLDQRFDDFKLVWAFINPCNYSLPRGEKIKIDTIRYYKTLLCARVWVTNSSMTRGLSISGIHTFELNTWHGSAIKHLGKDIDNGGKSFSSKGVKNMNRIMLAQGGYDVSILSNAFGIPANDFRITGLPRNDVLANLCQERQSAVKEKLGLPLNRKIILYAPTFREYDKDNNNNVVLAPPIDLEKWKIKLGEEYVLLLRAHYEVAKVMGIKDNDFVRNVSSYPNLNDLMIASDILISDYSSIFFDYAIQGKPMLCFAYDYERFVRERGVYFDIRKELSCFIDNEEDLLSEIRMMDEKERQAISRTFRDKYIESYGNASLQCLDIICDLLQR